MEEEAKEFPNGLDVECERNGGLKDDCTFRLSHRKGKFPSAELKTGRVT